jgi:hypothetical protein
MIRPIATGLLCASAAAAEPIIAIDITVASGEPYENAVASVIELGAQATSLSLMWDDLETRPGEFSPKDDWPAIANIYFPTTGLDFTLSSSVIDTTADRRPADLKDLPWDDPLVIRRFIAHAEAVLTRMPRVDFIAITVGNEVDVLLTDPAEIAAYTRFLAAVRPAIAALRPGVPYGTKLTFGGLTDPARDYSALIATSDGVFVTYYPLGAGFRIRPLADVPGDIAALVKRADGRGLWLLEAGYPSRGCDVPDGGQAMFVAALFAAVRAQSDIRLVSYTYLTDLSEPELDAFTQYYGIGDDCFRSYLASLGLRGNDSGLKPAAEVFRDLARP